MESLSKQELISTITKQADQIKRYEARLRDVVAAYKGLAKEKEALEVSLKALNKAEGENEGGSDESVATLVLSLSTLTAEKCRMEEAFQADKKVTREKYENMLAAMREETKTLVQQHQVEVNNLKAKIAYEIQEREKERADHAAMLKELHMKFDVERKTKEKLEDKVVHSSENQASQAELEKRVRDLSSSLEAARRRLARAEARTAETPALLVRLQNKLALVEQAHAVAIREEQIKVKRAEESARKASARHEERVAALESRVAELSRAVGRDDARRRADTLLIQRLRDSLNERMVERMDSCVKEDTTKSETDNDKLADSEYLHTLIDKLHILKKELIAENDKLGSPVDVAAAFSVDGYDVHMKCREQYDSLRAEFDDYKNTKAKASASESEGEAEARREAAALRERLDSLRRLLDDEKRDKEDWIRLHEEKLKSERAYHEEVTSELRNRITSLETQLGAARERYAALLHDTDGYLRRERARKVSEEPLWRDGVTESAPPHLLHYAHELARRDLDIQTLRKDKHALEGQYRDCQREATIEKERFKEVIRTLKEEIDRLRRVQSRSGANLEYLKNVVVSFLSAGGCGGRAGRGGDAAARRHMLNAIAAVLHFTPAETAQVMAAI